MKTMHVVLTILLLCLPVNIFSQDADGIINKYIQAVGGMDNIQKINTLKFTGKMTAGGMDINFTQTFKRPMKFMAEVSMQGMTFVQAYDGTQAWMINPFAGNSEPTVMPEAQMKFFKQQADFEGSLINLKDKGYTATLLGKEDYDSLEVYNILLVDAEGDTSNFFIDTDTYLLRRLTNKLNIEGRSVQSETIMTDYKEIEGFIIPHTMEIKSDADPMGSQKIVMEKVEANIPIEDSFFKMPETK